MKAVIAGLVLIVAVGYYFYPTPKYTVETPRLTVACGDTVFGIAERHFKYQEKYTDIWAFIYDIKERNHIYGDYCIRPGQQLVIPLYKKIEK